MKYEVGDKIRVYGLLLRAHDKKVLGTVDASNVCEVHSIETNDLLVVRLSDSKYYVHPKQLRKLIKKPRRRIWVNPKYAEALVNYEFAEIEISRNHRYEWIEMVEVKRSTKK
jgi:hypothetical protein